MTATIRRFAWIALGLTAIAHRSAFGQESPHAKVPISQVKEEVLSKKAVLVDVRERAEWEQGHVKDAVFLPLSQLRNWERDGLPAKEKAELSKKLPAGVIVYTHCAAGGRSVPGGEALRKLGYDARALKPGYKALLEAGFPKAEAR
jgi:rhodanese-related sulfurtransferase